MKNHRRIISLDYCYNGVDITEKLKPKKLHNSSMEVEYGLYMKIYHRR